MQVLLSSVRIARARRPDQMQVIFETQLSHPRTACLWDLTLAMQPHLTASALLPMAASAASMLAPDTQSHRQSSSGVTAVLVDTVVMGPPQLPGVSQMQRNPGCAVVQLSLEVASGCVSITYNGASQMQTVIAGTDTACSTDRLSHGSARFSPEAVTALLGASIPPSTAGPQAAVFGDVELAGSDQSGYALHPAMLEAHVSLRALTTAQTDSAPIWLKSAAAIAVFAMPTAATSFTAMSPLEQYETIACGVVSARHHPALSQEGVVLAAGQAPTAPMVAEVTRGISASQEAVEEGGLPADNTMLRMGAHERKLYIQAQVSTMFSSVLPWLSKVRLGCGAYLHLDANLQAQGGDYGDMAKARTLSDEQGCVAAYAATAACMTSAVTNSHCRHPSRHTHISSCPIPLLRVSPRT